MHFLQSMLVMGFLTPLTLSLSADSQSLNSTGILPPPGSTQEIVTTEITVTSGTKATEEVTTVISTITSTSTSTICTKCVAPPKSKPQPPSTSAGEPLASSLPSAITFPLTQPGPSIFTPKASTTSEAEKAGTGGAPIIVYSFTLPSVSSSASSAPKTSSKPELPLGTAAAFSQNDLYNTLSLTILTVSTPSIPGYGIVPSPSSIPGGPGPFSNATSTVTPVFSAGLLGNAYGGGFVKTASVFVTKLPSPNGSTEGVPPGYGFTSNAESLATTSVSSLLATAGPSITVLSGSVGFANQTVPTTIAIMTLPTNTGSPAVSETIGENSTYFFSSSFTGPVTSTGAAGLITLPAEGSLVPLASQTLVEIGAIGSPVSSSGESQIMLSPQDQTSASALPAATILSPVVGPNGVTTFAQVSAPVQPAVGNMIPIVGANGVTSLVFSAAQSAASTLAPVVGANGVTSLIAGTVQSAAPTLTPVVGANGVTSIAGPVQPAAGNLTPIVGANGVTSLIAGPVQSAAPTLSPVVGANGVASLIAGTVQFAAPTLSPVVGANGVTSLIAGTVQSAAPTLTPVVGANGVTSFVTSLVQSTASTFTPVVGANGVTTFVQVSAPNQPAAPVLTRVVGSNGVTFLIPAPAQSAATVFLPVVGANGVTSFTQALAAATAIGPGAGANGATTLATTSSPSEQAPAPALTAATVLTPIVGANGVTSLAVIPTPVVGANGLTSLAIFSTPVAAANGESPPAVILTPVVGANGLTSLAVLATPVVGANGLTSLAIGLGNEQTAVQSSGAPTLVPGSVLVAAQEGSATPPVSVSPGANSGVDSSTNGSVPNSDSVSTNGTVHVPLSPSQILEFQGSAVKPSLSVAGGLVGMLALLFLM
ncbi:hypothetical protein P7C71_g2965, partial [Lecanoromycetidae sp. Uapishka_2]